MKIRTRLHHFVERRQELRSTFGLAVAGSDLEESCIPSYCHPNPLAAYAAWWRLFAATDLASVETDCGPVLDFGASNGELLRLLPVGWEYHFVEQNDPLAAGLLAAHPTAERKWLAGLPAEHYRAIFALDSLEHNDDPAYILALLAGSLHTDGKLVICGPTESLLYRLGRRIAGFKGGYHRNTIYGIHEIAQRLFRPVQIISGPWISRLFVISVWKKR